MEKHAEKDRRIAQLKVELKERNDQIEAERQELEAERQERASLMEEAAAALQHIEEAVIRIMVQLELRSELDANGLGGLATQLRNIERLAVLPAELATELAAAKENVQMLADRSHFRSVNRVLMVLCDELGLHTQLVAELVLNAYTGQDDTDLELFQTIEGALCAITSQRMLIENTNTIEPSEKRLLLDTLVASVWAQVATGGGFPFYTHIVPRSDVDIMQAVTESAKEDLYELVRAELEPQSEAETP
ncbi:hypothetical protein E8E12_009770 [Didymella heteroderae]|uniref:Uncharacterized protein n=1 Tax=Didymella heteroderae TaxID=1769908 RepID=A0A9P4WVU4_9PLEO|nr:hypothetical protein E8E12_009770 [Didymella heteroderae]